MEVSTRLPRLEGRGFESGKRKFIAASALERSKRCLWVQAGFGHSGDSDGTRPVPPECS